jgi:UDP-N-acetylmuramoyl-L-alanyl-D-glutamate--2,6-diaminopimelate ligase
LDINRSIVVIGQAGERDYLKRPQVGEVVVNNATYAIFTYEDPRSEDPVNICNDIVQTFKDTKDNFEIIIDRREAIQKAIDMAQEKDMVLILGKGNETYETLKNGKIYFNDIEEAKNALKEITVKL